MDNFMILPLDAVTLVVLVALTNHSSRHLTIRLKLFSVYPTLIKSINEFYLHKNQ